MLVWFATINEPILLVVTQVHTEFRFSQFLPAVHFCCCFSRIHSRTTLHLVVMAGEFLRLCSLIIFLTILRGTGQVLWRMFLYWNFAIFLWLDIWCIFGGKTRDIKCHNAHDIWMLILTISIGLMESSSSFPP